MNKSIQFNLKSVIIFVIFITLSISLTIVLVCGIIALANLNKDWIIATIGAIGTIIGGVIGGIVAYIVANFQVQKSKEQQNNILIGTTYSSLRLLKDEIFYNQDVLNNFLPFSKDEDTLVVFQNELQYHQWEKISINLGPDISNTLFDNLCHFYRQINFLKNTSDIDSLDENLIKSALEGTTAILTGLDNNLNKLSLHLQRS
ncbi:hypothetical protein COK37_23465 [Bacillus thuringiensis]|uniref:hypothetical protein n=1 Tax=Bacillus thuringiensis TaxID=1428 RepID=UPI000BF4E5BD|nr:hypothetical protein [Bacillus thuringiensis]PEV43613.1 hypothetical protein CN432_22460 [Bacillus thuringiensis]PFR65297.1 hypothetical protein COK37_23465 [Bacillus thuringiensis]PFT78278.1 hypothetical protein COK70_17690 [Bacillus thuringiensis]PFV92738.1 hypothetical protein COL06_02650 [Bacillus thuringiensis]